MTHATSTPATVLAHGPLEPGLSALSQALPQSAAMAGLWHLVFVVQKAQALLELSHTLQL
jgi:hypothetical protein